MPIVTVSEKGQVVIPADMRRQLGITPGCQLDFPLEGNTMRVEVRRRIQPTRVEDGYGLLVCKKPGERCLSDFDVAQAMRECESFLSFDDRRFACRANRIGIKSPVTVPTG